MMKRTLLETKITPKANPDKKTHSPNLETIEMIENTLEENHDFRNLTELYKALPRGVQHATFKKVIVYLEQSNKIAYDKNGAVFWIFVRTTPKLDILEQNSTLLR